MKKGTVGICLLLITLLSTSCGLSPDEPAQMAVIVEGPAQEDSTETAESEQSAPSSIDSEAEAATEQFDPVDVANPAAREDSAKGYAYRTISPEAQVVYDEILNCILAQDTKIAVSTKDQDVLDLAYEAMRADYGGLFWVENYVYTTYTVDGEVTKLEFAPNYSMDQEERMVMQNSIDASVEQMLSGCSPAASDYEKVKYVFETLIHNVAYDLDAPENQNIISAFVYRRTVCQGYACATQYLLQQLGIESTVIKGIADNEHHAWNLVKLDGEYYYMDTTWGNAAFTGDVQIGADFINYDYLNVTTEEIERTHRSDVCFELPICTAIADNYFVKEGLYFSDWTPDAVGEMISTAWFSGRLPVSVKFSTHELTQQAFQYFITDKHIADFCPGITGFQYLDDLTQNVLTISF